MPSKNLGRVSIVPKGTWNANTVYNRLDAVVHNGSSWLAKKHNIGQMPAEGSDDWQLLAERGADGRQGVDGEPGKGLTIIGHFDTVESLESSVSTPEPGDAYSVGTMEPYNIYTYDGVSLSWFNNGPLQGPSGPQGPKGDTGDIGPQGPRGQKGDNGAAGEAGGYYTPAVTQPDANTMRFAFTPSKDGMPEVPHKDITIPGGGGTGGSGEDGGYYSPAVDADGNLSWTASKAGMPAVDGANIKGPKGDKGENGATGATGPVGPQGPKGDTGDTGPQGPAGPAGADGKTGPQGPSGEDGYTPVRGTDYWTDDDIATIKGYVDDAILGGAW